MIMKSEARDLLAKLGETFGDYLENPDAVPWLQAAVQQASIKNGWFTQREVHSALRAWASALNTASIDQWVEHAPNGDGQKVALILAGNIPMVGLHDVMAVLVSGHHAMIKCSSSDDVLIPAIVHQLTQWNDRVKEQLTIVAGQLKGYDAVIATGSNNSARYFESYFSSVPHIIRKNRTSVAVLNGDETDEQLQALMDDCFTYYGLGCRNVTKLYLTDQFDLNRIFEASITRGYLMDNKKYYNNYNYYKALMMLEREEFLENDLIILRNQPSLFSPISVLNYEYYQDQSGLKTSLDEQRDQIQCIVGVEFTAFGTAQKPALSDYADGINTLDFLSKIGRS